MADITFKHVVKTYDNKNTVVPDLNLEIHDKEFIVLVGPSGLRKVHDSPHDCGSGGD